jgi:hypothetical protein
MSGYPADGEVEADDAEQVESGEDREGDDLIPEIV